MPYNVMMKQKPAIRFQTSLDTIVAFLALILFLLGMYAAIRTGMNMLLLKKYPSVGVFTLNLIGNPTGQREEDCIYTINYTNPDGSPRKPNADDKKSEEEQQKRCIDGIKEARDTARFNDINSSVVLLFLGGCLLVVRRFFLR